MATNVLGIPLVAMSVTTGNNEDWIESISYLIGPEGATPTEQMDLRGIDFELEIRRRADDHEVIMNASTINHRMAVGAFPNYGYLLLYVPVGDMKTKSAGNYVADVVATADGYTRKIIDMTLSIVEGVTK